ncbi:hypothetical protein [Acetobacter malorum]|nr:hypothetical protein [Acetobacter malorum]
MAVGGGCQAAARVTSMEDGRTGRARYSSVSHVPHLSDRSCRHRLSWGAVGSAHHGLCWMADLAEDRLRLDRLAATAFRNFLPLTAAPSFLARQESSGPAVLRCAAALKGALPLASGWSIAIEATVVAAR